MRNGVMAIRRDGSAGADERRGVPDFSRSLAGPDDTGPAVCRSAARPADIIRVLASAFELSHLPNRAELRLKDVDRVIGYTLSQVKDDGGGRSAR